MLFTYLQGITDPAASGFACRFGRCFFQGGSWRYEIINPRIFRNLLLHDLGPLPNAESLQSALENVDLDLGSSFCNG